MAKNAKKPDDVVAELETIARLAKRLADQLRRATVLSPKEASRRSRVPETELADNFPPVLIKSWQARVDGKVITRQRLGYRLADIVEHNERRLFR